MFVGKEIIDAGKPEDNPAEEEPKEDAVVDRVLPFGRLFLFFFLVEVIQSPSYATNHD